MGVQMNVLVDQQMDLVAGRQQWTEGDVDFLSVHVSHIHLGIKLSFSSYTVKTVKIYAVIYIAAM